LCGFGFTFGFGFGIGIGIYFYFCFGIGFGSLSQFLDDETLSEQCGSVGFVAPEVYHGLYGRAVDMWALGMQAVSCYYSFSTSMRDGRLFFSFFLFFFFFSISFILVFC
jgi:serine/threonine protein kinase